MKINERVSDEIESLRDKAVSLYKPPFRFEHGYILDAESRIVADNNVEDVDGAALRVRGWGRISYMENAEALQDEVGSVIALAMTEFWQQQYRVAAEPVAFTEAHEISNMRATGLYLRAWPADRERNEAEGYTIPLYAAPQVTSVPELKIRKECPWCDGGGFVEIDHGPSMGIEVKECRHCRAAMLAAPAVQEEHALQNFRAAMEGIGHIRRTLEETFGGLHGTHCEPDVLVECKAICDAIYAAYRKTGNSPEIPDDWLAEAERLAEMYGTSFVVFRHGEEAQCADPTKVIISFTDEGLGHHSAAPKQEAE